MPIIPSAGLPHRVLKGKYNFNFATVGDEARNEYCECFVSGESSIFLSDRRLEKNSTLN